MIIFESLYCSYQLFVARIDTRISFIFLNVAHFFDSLGQDRMNEVKDILNKYDNKV